MTGSLLRVTAGTYYEVWYVGYWRVLCMLQYVLGRGRAITKTRGLLVSESLVSEAAYRNLRRSAMPAMPGAKVWTNTPLVHEAR